MLREFVDQTIATIAKGAWRDAIVLLPTVFFFTVGPATAVGLNDTGVTTCADASGATVSCTAATAVQGQDARYGRDAAAGTGALTKVGGGASGFDFTKISNGTASVPGTVLPPSAALGTGPNDWGCTYDNTTGLMWEVKTASGLRNSSYEYSWYSSNSATNGGGLGTSGYGTCLTTGRCDTEKFVQDVNALGMCGRTDWRLPSLRELTSLVRLSGNPMIDSAYFPNTSSYGYWTGSTDVQNSSKAWFVSFSASSTYPRFATSSKTIQWIYEGVVVRLVRTGI